MSMKSIMKSAVITLAAVLIMSTSLGGLANAQRIPCFFIFGDSLSDGGNNNNLMSMAKANFYPYGIDFPRHHKATGRFGNGRTPCDLIGEKIGIEGVGGYIPPYHEALKGDVAVKGVNYASGSAGILPETGDIVGGRIPLDVQLQRHKKSIQRIQAIHGGNTTQYLQRCLYSVWVGSNDWMLNHFMKPLNANGVKATTNQFANKLIKKLNGQFDSLIQMGARRVIMFGLSPLGCLPPMNYFGRCAGWINKALKDYNERLKVFAEGFRNKYPDLKITYIDVYGIYGEEMSNLKSNGFKVSSVPCCGASDVTCLPTSTYCPDRSKSVHWDNAHPTEAVNKIIAARAFHAQQPTDAIPEDISHLVSDMH